MGEDLPEPRFRILGETELRTRDGQIPLGAPQQRCVLALLLLEAGRVVPLDRLIDTVWPTNAPASARKAIQVYVFHLRRALHRVPDAELVTARPGYRADVARSDVDVHQFSLLVERAKDASVAEAAGLLRRALDLWRGPAMAELAHAGMRALLTAGLEEHRLLAVEERIIAELCLGRAADVVCELADHVAAYPLRERGHRLLMRALFYCGRQAEAVAAYHRARSVLAERLGTEPGPQLRALHEQLLQGRLEPDDTLAPGIADTPFGRVLDSGRPALAL